MKGEGKKQFKVKELRMWGKGVSGGEGGGVRDVGKGGVCWRRCEECGVRG